MNSFEQRIEKFGVEKIFIVIFLLFGVIILFMRPPYQLMDEINHFPRAWQISEGIFLSPTMTIGDYKNGGDFRAKKIFSLNRAPADALEDKIYIAEIPVSFLPDNFIFNANNRHYIHDFSIKYIEEFLATPLNLDEQEPIQIPNTGVYPPLTYLPQAVAAFIGRVLNLNAGIIFYLMGLSGLIFVAACVFYSMKFLPEAKHLIFLLAMMPMFVVEAASTSADAVTFGVCFLGTAWLLSLRNSTEKFSRAEIFGLIILSIMLACSKSVYGTILLLYFLIPRERFKNFWALGAAILLLNLFLLSAWSWLSIELSDVKLYTNYHLGFTETNTAAQKIFIMEHPIAFFTAMINSFVELPAWYWLNFIGTWGFLWNVTLPFMFYALYTMILIFFALSNRLNLKFSERGILIVASIISTIGFFLVHYLKWSPVGSEIVSGVQGRYFIPIALMMFGTLSILPSMRHRNLIALSAGIFSGVMMLLANFFAFY
ncbi:MAG: DUF2142 domain-containing protein [Selenomonadaceae bacterium]|nr:DUF2142 domain-containing protein [Selenomonadaceae bacterium]